MLKIGETRRSRRSFSLSSKIVMTKTGKIVLTVLIGLPLLCCLGVGLVFNEAMRQSSGRGDKELAGLKAKGVPTDIKDLYAKSGLPPEKNAATYYLQFANQSEKAPDAALIKAINAGMSRKATPEDKAKAAAAFPKLSKEYGLLRKATDQARCEFEIPVTGFRDPFPHFQAMKDGAKLLAYQATDRSKHGDYSGALDCIGRGYRLSQHTGDSFLIAMLVQAANTAITNRAFQDVIAQHAENRAFLLEARKLIMEQEKDLPSIRRAVLGELPITLSELESVKSIRDLQFSSPGSEEPVPSRPSASENIVSGPLRTLLRTELIHAYAELEPQLPKNGNDWQAADKALRAAEAKLNKDRNPATAMAQMLFPAYEEIGNVIGRLEADRRVTRAGIELLLDRASPKGLPAELPNQAWAIDPFTKRPMGYLKVRREFTVYSVGPDLHDDRGVPRGGDRKTYDIAFSVH